MLLPQATKANSQYRHNDRDTREHVALILGYSEESRFAAIMFGICDAYTELVLNS